VADHQVAGRGRRGRPWDAPPGSSLLMSVLLRPATAPQLVPAALAVAAAEACEEVAGVRPGLKWPNDLVVGDRKLAGVLAEVLGDAVVAGIGINVAWAPEGAAALAAVAGRDVDRGALLSALLERLGHWYSRGPEVASAYRRRCTTLGRPVRVELDDEVFTGTAADVSDEGHLLVDVGTCLRTVAAGDVVHLRAT
jgi:BirA family biotin operon repressor/biotin-[acetyl-CoA-carboxylase] ligase